MVALLFEELVVVVAWLVAEGGQALWSSPWELPIRIGNDLYVLQK